MTAVPQALSGQAMRRVFTARRLVVAAGALGGLLVVLGICFLVGYPLLSVLLRLFIVDGHLDLQAFGQAIDQPHIGTVFLNTAIAVGGSGLLAIVVACGLAWLNECTDARLGSFSELLPLLPLVVPPLASSIGWVFLLSPRIGYLNIALRHVLAPLGYDATEGPLNVFSWPGMILLYSGYLVPYAYFQIATALRNLDSSIEEASRVCGAGRWKTLRRVTVPAVLPSLASAAVLVLIIGFALFSIPVVVGTGAGHEVLSVRIVHLLTASFPPQTGVAVVLSVAMLIVIVGAAMVQSRLSRSRRSAMVSGRGRAGPRVSLGIWRIPARAIMFLYLVLISVLPFLSFLLVSFERFWSPNIDFGSLGLGAYRKVFAEGQLARAGLIRSVELALIGATLAAVVAIMLVVVVRRSGPWIARGIPALASLPGSVSHIVIATGFILAFAASPFRIGGTALILLLCYITLYLPQTYFSTSSAVSQLGDELMDASRTCGGGALRTFRKILLPLSGRGIAAGWMLAFVLIIGDLTASVLLASTNNTVVGFAMLDLYQDGTYPEVSALAVGISIVCGLVLVVVTRLTGEIGTVRRG